MLRIPSDRYARWLGATGLLATLLGACSDPQDARIVSFDVHYGGAWELTGIHDSAMDTNVYTLRSPTAEEARTWHVFGTEDYLADTLRAPVTVDWAGRSGSGYWYFGPYSTVQIRVTLTGPGGGTEDYVADLWWAGQETGFTTLDLSDNHWYLERYRKVGEP
jgi:hypothetical protein